MASNKELRNILNVFLNAYTERNKDEKFSDWLGDRLHQEIPGMTRQAGEKLAEDIIGYIAEYDRTLQELNAAVDAGQSKEEWLAESIADTYADLPIETVGKKLQQIEESYITSNTQLMEEMGESGKNVGEAGFANTEPIEWNKYSVKNKLYEIGNQVALNGLTVAANVLKEKAQREEPVNVGGIIKNTIQDGLKKDPQEIKAVVAGAVKTAAEKGLRDVLPENTPTETICDMAGAAVESAEALVDVANGESTITEAVDKIGKASIAAGCRHAGNVLKGSLAKVPVVGPIIVDMAGGLIDHVMNGKLASNVYTVFHDAAVATWEGIKESRIGKMVRFIGNRLFG